jgi:ABC-2 type transport system permease protein
MRAWTVFVRQLRLQLRDRLNLALTLLTGAVFVLLYWLMTGGGSTTFRLLLLDEGPPAAVGGPDDVGAAVVAAAAEVRYPNGQPIVVVQRVAGLAEAEDRLREREAAALVVLPAGLAGRVGRDGTPPPAVTLVGDPSNPGYILAAVVAQAAVQGWADAAAGRAPSVAFVERMLGKSGSRSEFEQYVPGLFLVAIMMMLFTVALAVAREVEAGTLQRLQLTRMRALDYLAGVSATQVLVGLCAMLVTLGTAAALGFRSAGPLWAVVLVGALAAVPVVGIGLLVACLARTAMRAYLVASVPFMLLMFFSGAVYPLPKVELFRVAGRVVGVFDFLPTVHAVAALHRIVALGVGLADVAWELTLLGGLGVLYFAAGVWLFHRRHLRAEA